LKPCLGKRDSWYYQSKDSDWDRRIMMTRGEALE